MQGGKGGDFFGVAYPKGKKILPVPCMEKSPYLESESKLAIKLVKNVGISRVFTSFRSYRIR